MPAKTALSLTLLGCTRKRKYNDRLMDQNKDRERSLTSYCHGLNRLNLGRKGSLIPFITNRIRGG